MWFFVILLKFTLLLKHMALLRNTQGIKKFSSPIHACEKGLTQCRGKSSRLTNIEENILSGVYKNNDTTNLCLRSIEISTYLKIALRSLYTLRMLQRMDWPMSRKNFSMVYKKIVLALNIGIILIEVTEIIRWLLQMLQRLTVSLQY